MSTLVLGVGHPDRGDDAAGTLVVERLQGEEGIVARPVTADPSSMLTEPLWSAADRVVLVDTVRTGAAPGTVHRWGLAEVLAAGEVRRDVPVGTHDLGVATTLRLAVALDRVPRELTVIGIEGRAFEVGEAPTPAVLAAVAQVVGELAEGGAPDAPDRRGGSERA